MVVESSDSSLFLKRNFRLRAPNPLFIAEALERRIKQLLIQLCGPVFISIREGGFVGRFPDPEMNQFAQAATQTIADLTQRVGMGELAEQHRHQLRPATEAFGAPFGLVLLDQRSELGARKMLEQLIEQTGCLYDWSALLFPDSGQDRPAANEQILLSINYRRAFSLDCLTRHSTQESVLDKSATDAPFDYVRGPGREDRFVRELVRLRDF